MDFKDELAGVVEANREEIESELELSRSAMLRATGEATDHQARMLTLQGLLNLTNSAAPDVVRRHSLYDAMIEVIQDSPLQMLRASDIANEINRRHLYRMGDGRPVEAQQIRVRVGKRPDLFVRDGTFIKLA
jgi:hypothetical protein